METTENATQASSSGETAAPPILSFLERPLSAYRPGEDLYLPLLGWVATDMSPIEKVIASIDGHEFSLLLRRRPDVAAAVKKKYAIGYDDQIPASHLSDIHKLQLKAVLMNGEEHSVNLSTPAQATDENAVNFSRKEIGLKYIRGAGLELGALHNPVQVDPRKAKVTFVDKYDMQKLQDLYPEIPQETLVANFLVGDGQTLQGFADNGQDFIIANHVIEHFDNPLLALKNIFRVVKPGGIVYLAVPDKRHTPDITRELTSFEHLHKEYLAGSETNRATHFEEWAMSWDGLKDIAAIQKRALELMNVDYSIHFHVWTCDTFFDFLFQARKTLELPFEIEFFYRNPAEGEGIYILRKHP